ncbi:hypothetical protein EX30DRAFT_228927 [Ascodesmis nigricans]|uniref:Uncharacterized protein n=1 Tax=Ascodesmis nigricans TaxID=341454 RepID=A0A4S2MIL8_9PEZI|nr:hypothetical protein EX30DRAFT_228927 [Ascodesmis nigricans]
MDDDKSSNLPLSLEHSALRTLQDSESRKPGLGGSKKPATKMGKVDPRKVAENTALIRSKDVRGSNVEEKETPSGRKGGRFLAQMDLQGILCSTTRDDTVEKLDHDTPAPYEINQGYITTSDTSDSLSDLNDDEEYFSVPEEDPESWISRLPERHQDTAAVLTKITKSLLSFLMTAEERADLALKDYKAKTDMVVKKLKELHHDEYAAFLEEYQKIRNKVLEEGDRVARELGEIGEGLKTGMKVEEAVGKVEEEYKGLVDRLKGVMEM